jgi:hypothetical protein
MVDVIFTANRLNDGVVIWLTDALCWSETATQAAVFNDAGAEAARDEVAAACHRNLIVAAYEVAVDGRADRSMRERIRAGRGPTIMPPQDNLARHPQPPKRDG